MSVGNEHFTASCFQEVSDIEKIRGEKDQRQKVGIDKIVHLRDGKQHNIDEKVDRKGYPRFLYRNLASEKYRSTSGWAMKEDQQTDYIAYLVEPKQDYYLIPYKEIKNAYS